MRRAIWVAACALLAGSTLISTCEARLHERLTSTTGKAFALPRPDVEGIPNFAEIEAGLARGGKPSDAGIEYLRSRGYRTVVSFLDDPREQEKLARAGIEYVGIPIHSGPFGCDVPTDEQLRSFLSVVSDPARRPVFFHCLRGRDRTGAMTGVYRIERGGWTPSEAIEEMRAFGFRMHYKGLLRMVRDWGRRDASGAREASASPPAKVATPARPLGLESQGSP